MVRALSNLTNEDIDKVFNIFEITSIDEQLRLTGNKFSTKILIMNNKIIYYKGNPLHLSK